jgi:predicted dehydrogenase
MSLLVGIVGYGGVGRYHAKYLSKAGARVVAADARRESDLEMVRYDSLESMLPDVDAVTIAVPNHLHAKMARKVILAGKPVMVEKPLGITTEDLDGVEAALATSPVPFLVGFRLRWNPQMRALRDRLSQVRRIRCIYRMGIEDLAEDRPWTRRQAQSGGAFFTLGVHALDLARWLAKASGEPLSNIQATAAHRDESADFPLVVSVSGTLPQGVEIEAGTDLRGHTPYELELEVDAERGSYPDPTLPGPGPDLEESPAFEFGGLMTEFVRRAESGEVDRQEHKEFIQSHRDLIQARNEIEK